MTLPFRLERRHVHDDAAARVGRLADANHQHVTWNAEILDRAREREGIGWDDANIGIAVDEAVLVEILWIDYRRVDVGEDLEIGADAGVVAVGRQPIRNDALALL